MLKIVKTFFLVCVAELCRTMAERLLRVNTYCWNHAEDGMQSILAQDVLG